MSESKLTYKEYLVPLDTLRVLAVFLVFWEHWLPGIRINHFSPGWWGVHLFFTISGFLISGILIDTKQESLKLNIPTSQILKNFYIRRFLRIFPLYYMVLFIGFWAGISTIKDNILWHSFYGSNFLWIYKGVVTHFWSLAVEEQFYLFWPILILFTPRRFLIWVFILAVFITPAWTLYFKYNRSEELYYSGLYLVGCLHSLGIGAVLALVTRKGYNINAWGVLALLFIVVVLYVSIIVYNTNTVVAIMAALLPTSINLLIILFSIKQNIGILNKVFNNKAIRYLGKISYGLYVIHPFAQTMVQKGFAYFNYPYHLFAGKFQFVGYIIVTIVISSISWELFEKRINNLKKHFEYMKK